MKSIIFVVLMLVFSCTAYAIEDNVTGWYNILIGVNTSANGFDHVILIGDNLTARKDYDYQFGDRLLGRKMTEEESKVMLKLFNESVKGEVK